MRAWTRPEASSADGTTTYQPEGKGEKGKRFFTGTCRAWANTPAAGRVRPVGRPRVDPHGDGAGGARLRYRGGPPRTPLTEARAAPAPRPRRDADDRRGRALDALGVLAAFAAGLALWAADRGAPSPLLPADAPAWARIGDHLLDGPDAGAWASNAVAVWLGRTDELDPHRLPVLPHLTALALHLRPDPALAGHLVNHLLHVLLGPVVFLLGRAWMGRGMALAAALVAVGYGPGIVAADRYGVDPLVAVALPTALLAAEGAARRWALAPLFGIVVGLAACSHLTTVGIPFPALLLTFLRGDAGWRRWLGAGGLAAGVLLGVGLAFWDYPTLPWAILVGSLAEGVAPAGTTGDAAALSGSLERARSVVTAGGPAALERAVAFLVSTTRPAWLPWAAALWLPWLGILGLGLSERGDRPASPLARVLAPVRGLSAGLPLAAALVPVLAFAAADSPPRYTHNFFPLGALLVFRGLASVLALVEAGIRSRLPAWPSGGAGLAVGLAVAVGLWSPERTLGPLSLPPRGLDLADWRLGATLRAHFPPGGGASCLRREVVAYAGRVFCPRTPGFDFGRASEPVRAHLDAECGGDGPVPYVILSGVADGSTDQRRRMDAWVEANAPLVATFSDAAYEARVYAVARASAPDR